ncbi:uncharacterized protein METZ01_LOCUS106695, partial [marine metagenome]
MTTEDYLNRISFIKAVFILKKQMLAACLPKAGTYFFFADFGRGFWPRFGSRL